MAIRVRDIDWDANGKKLFAQVVSLGDITANATEKAVFVAPFACVLDTIDVYSGQAVAEATTNSVTIMTIRPQLADTSACALAAARGNSANGVSSTNDIQANTQYQLVCTANNSLTAGRVVELNFSQQGSGVLSAVIVVCTYRALVRFA